MTGKTLIFSWLMLAAAPVAVLRADAPATFDSLAKPFLQKHCFDCHGTDAQEGGVTFHEITGVNAENAELWKRVWELVALKEMPPREESNQPAPLDRVRLSTWITSELERAMKDKGGFQAHLRPSKGNHLDHDLLFGKIPEGLTPTSTPARIWRIHPQEHLVRLNELIDQEPAYDPQRPGQRTRGDHIPWNENGEVKVYFGLDQLIGWVGGSAAYAAAITGFSSPLTTIQDHGLQNYPILYSVNGSDATQVARDAEEILRFMAYGPKAEPYQFADKVTDIDEKYKHESVRGLAQSLFYKKEPTRPLTPVYELMQEPGVSNEKLKAAVDYLFEALTFRPPTPEESAAYVALAKQSIDDLGKEDGAILGLVPIFLDRDALFRAELAAIGTPDAYNRVMLQDWELASAVNAAFSYIRPDETLRQAVLDGRMKTREDVQREVARMLQDDAMRKPRVLQFFREYFDYDRAGRICKDTAALSRAARFAKGYTRIMFGMTAHTDRLVELILQEDKNVLQELLTTDRVVVNVRDDALYFSEFEQLGKKPSPPPANESNAKQPIPAERGQATVPQGETNTTTHADRLIEQILQDDKKALPKSRTTDRDVLNVRNDGLYSGELEKLKKNPSPPQTIGGKAKPPTPAERGHATFPQGETIYVKVADVVRGDKGERTLTTLPANQRRGILTHPSWLVSHSDAVDNHAILRGRWIRERLLGDAVPDVPITVNAMLPDEPNETLRHRMRVTRESECWRCHQKMDPLGLPFEMYNHAGLYRTTEQGRPVDTRGEIINSGDPNLDGPVANALEMIDKLAESERVQQVFVRHAFRYWMGRNETIHDAPVLQEAYRAYRDGGGSMKAMLTSLITSDAFLYRTADRRQASMNAP